MDKPFDKKKKRNLTGLKVFFLVVLVILGTLLGGAVKTSTQHRNSRSYHLAPHPDEWEGPVIQVYSARTWGAKKALAVHTWIATKRQGDDNYKVSQIIGWRIRRTGTALVSRKDIPDKGWYGNPPTLLLDLRGPEVEAIIDKVDLAIDEYPWSRDYTLWPGPNSNTFIAWIGLNVPELGLDLPSTAIGKDWRPIDQMVGLSTSGTGIQFSLFGLAGASIGYEEGLEINLLSLSFEVDLFDMALEIPGYGRIGPKPVDEKAYSVMLNY